MPKKMDVDSIERILKNHVAVISSSQKIRNDDKQTYEEVAKIFKKLAKTIEEQGYASNQQKFHEVLDFDLFGLVEDLVSDAPEKKITALEDIQDIFIDRFNSTVKDRSLLYKLLWAYYLWWLKCWRYHCRIERTVFLKIRLSSIGYANQASDMLSSFINNVIEPEEQAISHEIRDTEKKKKEKKKKGEKDESFRDDMV